MKIGILTYHCPPNFGAQLQAISTIGFLRRMGHEPIVIDWYPDDLRDMYAKRVPAVQIEEHLRFARENMPLSAHCSTEDEIIEVIDSLNLDLIIAGSDALFKYYTDRERRYFVKRKLHFIYNPVISCMRVDGNPFFGGFMKKLKKKLPLCAYAVSSQNANYKLMSREEKETMRDALSAYSIISVRDEWTRQMTTHITGRTDVEIYPDPVFSFNQNCHIHIPTKEEIIAKFGLKEDYILFSFRSKYANADYIKRIADEVEKRGTQPVSLPMPEGDFDDGIEKRIPLPLSPIDWYALIIHSRGYIGERMHPIVVCLHNSVPFFSFDEYGFRQKKHWYSKEEYIKSSSKTYQILQEAGLLSNIYSEEGGKELPEPSHVINNLLSFDHNHCRQFSIEKQKKVTEGINSTLK